MAIIRHSVERGSKGGSWLVVEGFGYLLLLFLRLVGCRGREEVRVLVTESPLRKDE